MATHKSGDGVVFKLLFICRFDECMIKAVSIKSAAGGAVLLNKRLTIIIIIFFKCPEVLNPPGAKN